MGLLSFFLFGSVKFRLRVVSWYLIMFLLLSILMVSRFIWLNWMLFFGNIWSVSLGWVWWKLSRLCGCIGG